MLSYLLKKEKLEKLEYFTVFTKYDIILECSEK